MSGLRKAVQSFKVVVLLFPFSLLLAAFPAAWHTRRQPSLKTQAPSASRHADQKRLAAVLSSLPASFEPNRGQSDPSVKFLSRGPGYALFLTPNEAVLSLPNHSSQPSQPELRASVSSHSLENPRCKSLQPD